MLMRPNGFKLVIGLISLLLITGCVDPHQLERLGLITALGFDLEKENEIKGTLVVSKFDPLEQVLTRQISAEANTIQTLRAELNLESDQHLVLGQLRCVIYSNELAKKGIVQLVDALNRDPTVGNMVYLTIAEEDATSILTVDESKVKINIGTYLYNLIRQNVENEQLMSPTLHEFNHSFADFGQDPVLPIIKTDKENVSITGVALFNDDRMVARINNDKLFYLKILADKYRSGSKELAFNRQDFEKVIETRNGRAYRNVYNKLFITIDNIQSDTKVTLIDKDNLRFKVEVYLKSRLLEATERLDLGVPENVKFIEEKMSQEIEKQLKEMLVFFQDKKVDPVGFGNEYMAKVRGEALENKNWKEIYKNAKFDVQVKNIISKTGALE
jgi:spore germination protein